MVRALALLTLAACTRAPQRSAQRASCESCHASEAAEWRQSYHRTAFSDATFQRSLALEEPRDRAFCTDCHAPQGDARIGVGCTSCHAQPHTGARSEGTCNACHQFTFGDSRPELVQKTVNEHAASDFALATCESCHMPSHDGHRDHRFVSAHSVEQLRAGIRIHAQRLDTARVRVTIDSMAGHAFPTGDMFRRATLTLFAERADGAVVDSAERVFARTWGGVRGGPQSGHRTERSDTRIRGHYEEVVAFDATQPIAQVHYVLRFERVLAMRAGHASVESSDVLAEGNASP